MLAPFYGMDLMVLPRDPRTAGMCFGVDVFGQPRPVTPALLRNIFADWPVTDAAPAGVQTLLTAARAAAIAGLTAYELIPAGILVSLQAVEAALRTRIEDAGGSPDDRNGRALTWDALWNRAVSLGLVERQPDHDGRDMFEYGRMVRNMFSHPRQVQVMPYAMAIPMIETSHHLVARLYPPGADRPCDSNG